MMQYMPEAANSTYLDDARLVTRSVAGDHGAYRQLFEAYSPLIYRICSRMIGDPEEAADLTQDIFVRAYERLASLRDPQAFHAWITRLAANMAHDKARRAKPRLFSLDAPPPGQEEGMEWQLADSGGSTDAGMMAEERTTMIQSALQSLSSEHRIVVVLHHLENMPVEEIGNLLKIPTGTVKSRLARARAELRKVLAPYIEM